MSCGPNQSRKLSFAAADTSTPTGSNYQPNGAPAPPRDGNPGLSDLFDLFTF